MIRAIVFDIGGVFLHQTPEHFARVGSIFGMDPRALSDGLYATQVWDQHKRGQLTEHEYWTALVRSSQPELENRVEELRDAMEVAVSLDEPLVSLTRRLRKQFCVAALSNAGPELERRLDRFGIQDLFDHVWNSHYVGMAKPDESIYALVAREMGLAPEQLLFVDDKERNTCVAASMGWQTHIYTDAERFRAFLPEVGVSVG